jgi:hypothetical protein
MRGFIGQISIIQPLKMLHDSDGRMSCLESFNPWTVSTVTCSKKLKRDINVKELLPFSQLNCIRKSCTVGRTKCCKPLAVQFSQNTFYSLPKLTALCLMTRTAAVDILCFDSYFKR